MRKLLLSSTALATAAVLTANIAVADVSISAGTEWTYSSRSSQVAASDGTTFATDSEIAFNFSNKTDSGLTIGYTAELEGDGDGTSTIDESTLSISGGFGKIMLGRHDSVMDTFGFEAEDAVTEQSGTTHAASASIDVGNGAQQMSGDDQKVTYHLPAMGGLTVGVSFADSGTNTGTDETAFGFSYTAEAAGNTITLSGASATQEVSGGVDIDSQNIGAKITSGNVSFIVANSTYEASDENRSSTGAGASYTMANGMVIGAYTFKSEDDSDAGEEYTKTGVEAMYTIAAGLKAIVNVDDYDYKIGTDNDGAAVADSGTISKLTIQATF